MSCRRCTDVLAVAFVPWHNFPAQSSFSLSSLPRSRITDRFTNRIPYRYNVGLVSLMFSQGLAKDQCQAVHAQYMRFW
jgi:hypothetical protein